MLFSRRSSHERILHRQSIPNDLLFWHCFLSSAKSHSSKPQPSLFKNKITYKDNSQIAYLLIFSFDQNYHSRSSSSEKRLTIVGRGLVIDIVKLRMIQKICTRYCVYINDCTINGNVPVMIGKCIQKCLIDSTLSEKITISFLSSMCSEDVMQRVSIIFEPELILNFYISDGLIWINYRAGLTRINNDIFSSQPLGSTISHRS